MCVLCAVRRNLLIIYSLAVDNSGKKPLTGPVFLPHAQLLAGHPDPRVAHETARLCNAIASDRMGRNYLMLPGGGAVQSLVTVLRTAAEEPPKGAANAGGGAGAGDGGGGGRDGPAVVQSLAALQKLSLRRAAQSQMIGQGLVAWLVSYMQVGNAVPAVLACKCGPVRAGLSAQNMCTGLVQM